MQHLPWPDDLPPDFESPRPISVTFIPATVFDNPALLRGQPGIFRLAAVAAAARTRAVAGRQLERSGRLPGSISKAVASLFRPLVGPQQVGEPFTADWLAAVGRYIGNEGAGLFGTFPSEQSLSVTKRPRMPINSVIAIVARSTRPLTIFIYVVPVYIKRRPAHRGSDADGTVRSAMWAKQAFQRRGRDRGGAHRARYRAWQAGRTRSRAARARWRSLHLRDRSRLSRG
jgi:hypothetical protein